MNQNNTYRTNGAIGALLDEYEKSIVELKAVISSVSESELLATVDSETKDPDCVSIQSILTHIISAGYNYVIEIRNWLGEQKAFRKKEPLNSIDAYKAGLDQMFEFNVKLFDDYPSIKIDEVKNDKKITVRWKQQYDVEQLYEHAIVHVFKTQKAN